MYTSPLEKIGGRMLFTWVTAGTGVSCSAPYGVSLSVFVSPFCCYLTSSIKKFRNHDPWKISFLGPSTSDSNQRSRTSPYETPTQYSFQWTRMKFLFVGRQNIIKYWDLFSKISRNRHNLLVQKISCYCWWEIFVKKISYQPTVLFCWFCWIDSACTPFLLPLPICFLRVCLPTLFAAALKVFLPLTTSAFFGATNSNKSAPTRFAAGTIHLHKTGIRDFPTTCAIAPIPLHAVDQYI